MTHSWTRLGRIGLFSMALLLAASNVANAKRQPNAVKRKDAKKECLAEDASLKGKKLRACIAEKMKKATDAATTGEM